MSRPRALHTRDLWRRRVPQRQGTLVLVASGRSSKSHPRLPTTKAANRRGQALPAGKQPTANARTCGNPRALWRDSPTDFSLSSYSKGFFRDTALHPNWLRSPRHHCQRQYSDSPRSNALRFRHPFIRNAQRLDALCRRPHEERFPVFQRYRLQQLPVAACGGGQEPSGGGAGGESGCAGGIGRPGEVPDLDAGGALRSIGDARAAAQGASATGPGGGPLLPARAVPQRPAPRGIPLRLIRAAHCAAGRRRQAGPQRATGAGGPVNRRDLQFGAASPNLTGMSTVQEIESVITKLPLEKKEALRDWLDEAIEEQLED